LKKNRTENIKKRLLVIRTSAMGDVSLTVPVLRGMREQYPDAELFLLTRHAYKSFFASIEGIRLITTDFKGKHKGITGIFNLYRDILYFGKIDFVIDLHDVVRSKVLRTLFRMSGAMLSVIDKGRKEKAGVISGKNKNQLKHTVQRYCDAFTRAGFPVMPSKDFRIIPSPESVEKAVELTGFGSKLNIGVAPYAKHKLKTWPEEKFGLHQLVSTSERLTRASFEKARAAGGTVIIHGRTEEQTRAAIASRERS
jgi:ADP-heptose:LPS heptosyltransferase